MNAAGLFEFLNLFISIRFGGHATPRKENLSSHAAFDETYLNLFRMVHITLYRVLSFYTIFL